ncbi:hemolysin family protein [Spongisporangium articulatum]|uniref:Hemolysin family protein n=1 Tax=Spongisporangium articulatum TaxID=3362603 RepID=A0ABW8AMF1_9ACTN
MTQLILLAVALTVLAGLAAASEAALSRIGRTHAAELAAARRPGAAALARVAEDPAPVLSVATLLRVSSESGAAVSVVMIMIQIFGTGWRAGLVATAVMAAVSFVAVGVGPRTLGQQYAEGIALRAAPGLSALTSVLGPLAQLLVGVGNMLTPGRGRRYGPFASEAELRHIVDRAGENELLEADERKMIHSVIDLGDTLTREVMVPRTDVVSVDHETPLHSAMSLFLRSGFSRVPVAGEGNDDIVGILYLKDVARRLHEHPEAGETPVETIMRRPVFVPDSKPADALLREMQHAGHAAVVVDEYGGTAGLVTIEDILEEIVGEIADEYDTDTPEHEQLDDGTWRVSSRLHIADLGEVVGVELDDEEVDTVGGLLSKAIGRVPITGSKAEVAGLELTAERFEGRRHHLATVLVRRLPEAELEEREARERDQREHERSRR